MLFGEGITWHRPWIAAGREREVEQVEWWRAPAEHPDSPLPEAREGHGALAAWSRVPFPALMVLTFILVLAPQTFIPALAPLRIALLAAALAVTAYLVDRLLSARPLVRARPGILTTACLAIWAVLTVPFSLWPGGSVSFLLNTYFKTLAIFWLLTHVVDTRD